MDDVTGGRATGHSATLDGRPDQIPAALLVAYSALGAVYALFTIGWVIAILRSTVTLPNLFFNAMYQVGQWLAAASPLAFFGVVFLLTPRSQSRRVTAGRLLALALGLILVAPWPFIVGGAA